MENFVKNSKSIALATGIAVLAGCASTPEQSQELLRAEARFEQLDDQPNVLRFANKELERAERQIEIAGAEYRADGITADFNHRLYLANRNLDIAEAKTQLGLQDARAIALADERDEIILAARLSSAERARLEAEADAARARIDAEQARTNAALADAKTRDALESRSAAEAEASIASARAAEAAREREAAKMAAAEAREEANQAAIARAQALEEARAARDLATTAEERREAAERARLLAEEQAKEARDRAESLAAQLTEIETTQSERGLVFTLSNVLFNVDEATLNSGGIRDVRRLSEFLLSYPERKVRIEGFTDSTGSEAYNEELSKARAATVAQVLEQEGVDSARIVTAGYGEGYPVATNATAVGRQQNRRVEIIISDDDQLVDERVAAK